MNSFSARPAATEYAPYYHTYVRLIAGDPLAALRAQPQELRRLLAGLSDEQALLRYAPGKWSLKEMLVHMLDTERIFAYRALRIARGDTTPLPGFEQDDYVPASGADARPLAGILAEYDTVRAASLSLLESFGPEQIRQQGTASGQPVSVRAMAYILAGHEAHHLHILQERYLPQLAA
jgi:uncharacterized damage-inducible protein DinB